MGGLYCIENTKCLLSDYHEEFLAVISSSSVGLKSICKDVPCGWEDHQLLNHHTRERLRDIISVS